MSATATPTEPVAAEARAAARAAGLVYVTDDAPGYARRRHRGAFRYVRPDGSPLRDKGELARIAKLAIPPAYDDVWICMHPRGHLQATGRDARGRKQYRYHADWRVARDGGKFERMAAFAASLPRLRRHVQRDLAQPGLPRAKVLATVARLLDTTRVRIGNEDYARDNHSYGLTTLRARHAQFVRDGRLVLRFRGKGGVDHEVTISDARLVAIVRRCHQLPGQALFQYLDDDGARHAVTSELVNDYLRDAMGASFTAKDFRTHAATMRAVVLMAATPRTECTSERAMRAAIVEAIRQVAAELRNTVAVCRKSYIDPRVFERWRDGSLHAALGEGRPRSGDAALRAFLALAGRKPQPPRAAGRQAGAIAPRPVARRRAVHRRPAPALATLRQAA
ncbi:MAG: DNA topoisomerase IB [Proteobacteria bacterium]|nr:DNA topoisomerase IB [Pseudomonadota bacterium]